MARSDQRVGKVLDSIAKPHYPWNDENKYDILSSKKVSAIKELLDENGFDTIIDEKYGIIAHNQVQEKNTTKESIQSKLKETSLLVISHIDNIKKFNKSELQEKLPKQLLDIQAYEEHDKQITGALDNTLLNGILLSIMQMRKVNFSDDCNNMMFLFSIGEEDEDERGFEECSGVSNFMNDFHQDLIENNTKVLNLDVTAQEYHEYTMDKKIAVFIEYDKSLQKEKLRIDEQYSPLASLMLFDELSSDIQFCDYGEDGTSDDLEDVTQYNIWAITVALNTYGEIHSKKNYTYMKHIDKYFNFLHNLILFLRKD